MYNSRHTSIDWYYVQGGVSFGYYPSKIRVSTYFPFELGFSMTIHKAQGRTMKKVMLALSEHPVAICKLTWSAIYVALSRVEYKDDIRLLITRTNNRVDAESIRYVTHLERKADVDLYFSGFPPCTRGWSNTRGKDFILIKLVSTSLVQHGIVIMFSDISGSSLVGGVVRRCSWKVTSSRILLQRISSKEI